MHLRVLYRLGKFFDDERIGRIGGTSHSEIDDVRAVAAFLVFQRVEFREEVGGKTFNTICNVDFKGAVVFRRVVRRLTRVCARRVCFRIDVDCVL